MGRVFGKGFVALYCGATALAFIWLLTVSMKTRPEFFSTSPWSLPANFRLDNFAAAWTTGHFSSFLLNSTVVTVSSVAVGTVVSAMAAYALARASSRAVPVVAGVLVTGLLIPTFGVLLPLYLILRSVGLLDSLLGLGIVYVSSMIPFSVFVLVPFFRTLPVELEEAAMIDGAGTFRMFFSVVFPVASPALWAVAALQGLSIWNEFLLAWVLLSDESRFTIPVGINRLGVQALVSGAYPELAAGLILSMLPTLGLLWVAQDRIRRSMVIGR